MQTWSAVDHRGSECFGTWADDLARAFVRLEPARISDGPFLGRIRQTHSADIRISRVDATPHRVARLKQHIAAALDDVCFINIQTEGVGHTSQRDRNIETRPLDIAVIDTTEPFRIEHRGRFSLFSVTVPSARLPKDLLERGAINLSWNRTGREIGRTIINHARMALLADQHGLPRSSLFTQQLMDLMAYAAQTVPHQASKTAGDDARLAVVMDFIDRNLADERLGAAMIAQAFNLSPRYVHKLFEPVGTTVSQHINSRRLDVCATELRRVPGRLDSIGAIAYRNGYRDVSYFNRRFKRKYGETPSEYRRRHLLDDGT